MAGIFLSAGVKGNSAVHQYAMQICSDAGAPAELKISAADIRLSQLAFGDLAAHR